MKKSFLVAAAIVAAIFACTRLTQSPAPGSDPPIKNCFCSDTTNCQDFCSQLPIDVTEKFNPGYDGALTPAFQPPFDVFSWQTFIALNWPADARGNPLNCSLNQNTSAPRVWESYTDPAVVFNSEEAPLLLSVNESKVRGQKFFFRLSKSKHPLTNGMAPTGDFGNEEADGHALIDRNLNFALFEIRINPDEVNFIRDSGLTTLAGIDAYYQRNKKKNPAFSLPSSQFPSTIGAMEIKASWRILDPAKGDDTTRYYTRDAVIYVAKENSADSQAFTVQAKVGLVGMHIIRKTHNFADMIWSTFEHMDNTPDDIQAAQTAHDTKKRWSFYNVECLACPIDSPPVLAPGDNGHYKWSRQPPYAKNYAMTVPGEEGAFGTQVVRLNPIYYRTQQVNQLWQAKLQGTVWANYRLVGSQWTLPDDGKGFNTVNVPFRLGNTTLETYVLENASCINCHGFASVISGKDTISTDFSFLFGEAK